MNETILAALKSFGMAAILTTFGIYAGAVLIALLAALSRLAYTSEKVSLRLFISFFIMSLSLTMIMVHVGQLQEWNDDLTIIVSGVTAFLCREVLESIVSSKDLAIEHILKRFTGQVKGDSKNNADKEKKTDVSL